MRWKWTERNGFLRISGATLLKSAGVGGGVWGRDTGVTQLTSSHGHFFDDDDRKSPPTPTPTPFIGQGGGAAGHLFAFFRLEINKCSIKRLDPAHGAQSSLGDPAATILDHDSPSTLPILIFVQFKSVLTEFVAFL